MGELGYDSNEFVKAVRDRGKKPVIHSKPERKKKHRLDRKLYRKRYLIECFFHQLRRFRAIATRYEKTCSGHGNGQGNDLSSLPCRPSNFTSQQRLRTGVL
jgi:transposase